ncbi:MAG: hypothetical protein ACM3NI_05380 [Bacteroidota bacterium]
MKNCYRQLPCGITTWPNDGGTLTRILSLCAGAVVLLHGSLVAAAWVTINPPPGQVILHINYTGTPTVTFNVTAAQVGNGTAVAGTPAVEFEMSVQRAGGTDVTATMTATAPASLSSGSNQIPISDISWTSAAIAGAPGGTTLIPSGSFVAGANTIVSVTTAGGGNYNAGGALTFYFANTTVYPQGAYGPATVNYTASRTP